MVAELKQEAQKVIDLLDISVPAVAKLKVKGKTCATFSVNPGIGTSPPLMIDCHWKEITHTDLSLFFGMLLFTYFSCVP